MRVCSIWELLYIFSPEGGADLHFPPPKEGANFRRGCIIKALRYTNSETILYSEVLFITLLDTIVISSDDEIDGYKSDGNISHENNLKSQRQISGVLIFSVSLW